MLVAGSTATDREVPLRHPVHRAAPFLLSAALLFSACAANPSSPNGDLGPAVGFDLPAISSDADATSAATDLGNLGGDLADLGSGSDLAAAVDAAPDLGVDAPGLDGPRADGPVSVLDGGTDPFAGLSDDALRAALYDRVKDHTSLGYDAARDQLFGADGIEIRNGLIECYYTGLTVMPDGTRAPNGFNTEHAWPQSLGADTEPAHSDLHHLFPTSGSANNARGNYPYGDTPCADNLSTCTWEGGGSELGLSTDMSGPVFEVRPLRRGDISRAIFYFAVRYQFPILDSEEEWLRQWHDEDPPDALEVMRNDAIEELQGNRNPFVDRPDLVRRIADF